MIDTFHPWTQIMLMLEHYRDLYEQHKDNLQKATMAKQGLYKWEIKRLEFLN